MKLWGKNFGNKVKGKAEKGYLIIAQSNVEEAKIELIEKAGQRRKDLETKVVQKEQVTELAETFEGEEEELGSGYWSAEEKAENKAQQVNDAMQNINRSYGRMELAEEGYKLLKATQRDFSGKITREAWFAVLKDNGDYMILRQTNKHELDDSSFEFRYKGNGKNLRHGLKNLIERYEQILKQEKGKK